MALEPEQAFAAQRDGLRLILSKAELVLTKSLQQHQVRFAAVEHQ
ncbi:hypothetical protein [Rheinheimera sp. KL1]|nr:hypothetical protein [Rheinheimera sp. KL1]